MIQPSIKDLIKTLDFQGLQNTLSKDPCLANEGIPGDDCSVLAHPLHRICDGVFNRLYTEKNAVELAKLFLAHGANVNGDLPEDKKDTPLVAAASLRADDVAILYIAHGADIHHRGCHGGTALHWASWCGREKIVHRLLQENIDINKQCIDFKGTALLWAVHGYKFGGNDNRFRQVACARMLMEAGADKTISNKEGVTAIQFLDERDAEMIALLR